MKTSHIATLVSATLLMPLAAQIVTFDSRPTPAISVSGQAEVLVAPDMIDLRLGVETIATDLAGARAENRKRVTAIIEAMRAHGIEAKDIQTDWIGISPRYDHKVSRTDPVDHTVQNTLRGTLRDPRRFEEVLAAVIGAGATHVHGIDFRTTELRKHRDHARSEALKAAREKAELLAEELGVKRGRPLAVTENQWGGSWTWTGGWWGRSHSPAMMQNTIQNISGGDAEGGFAAGQIRISATVNASFAID